MTIMNHFALTVSDLEASARFYHGLLGFFGYELGHASEEVVVLEGKDFELILYLSDPKYNHGRHELYAPGFHHVALKAADRSEVDRVGAWLRENAWDVINLPVEYPDYPGNYYAVFFRDPDGLKWEVMTN